jgi:predicted ATP-dependent endonuclease of OLD family
MDKSELIFENPNLFVDYFFNDEQNHINLLSYVNPINMIIGANNCGKSRFLRNIMSQNKFFKINQIEFNKYNDLIKTRNSKLAVAYRDDKVFDQLKKDKSLFSVVKENLNKVNSFDRNNLSVFKDLSSNICAEISPNKYYIPTLRTAHSLYKQEETKFFKIENDILLETLNKYYELDKLNVEVFTGIHLYKDILNSRNSRREIRESFQKFEDFIGKNFFNNKQIDIVAEFNKDESLKGNNIFENISVHIDGESKTRYLYELGDGIQALIILIYKIFMAKNNSFIFIDEPEINLHPGMQRLFLEQITSNEDLKKKNLTYFISTHSNHFLDLTIEKDNVSIYSFTQKLKENGNKHFVLKNVNSGDNTILKDLGVNNSSVFMANCSIWVEGISDRNYIKAFLKSYCDYYEKPYPKEDIDFAFFEYAGTNIDHYIFDDKIEKEDKEIIIDDIKALALSNRIFLLADSDKASLTSKKGKRLKTLEENKTDNFIPKIIWTVREIENLFTNDVWKEILIELSNKTLIKDNEKLIKQKIDEALIEFNSQKFLKDYIGEFLEKIRLKMGKISGKFIINQSNYEVSDNKFGTIKNKRDLSEIIFNKEFSWEVFSQNKEIQNLTIEIYNFITNK